MRFLANENLPRRSIEVLRTLGYEVDSISEDSPGITDQQVIERAVKDGSIIVTFDRDYGELIFRHKFPAPKGVLYLRFTPTLPEEPGEYIHRILSNKEIVLEGYFTIAEKERVRQRKLKVQ